MSGHGSVAGGSRTLGLSEILYRQGFGTRRVCDGLVQQGLVWVCHAGVAPVQCAQPATEFEYPGLPLRVQGQDWLCVEPAYLMLHKPAGYECSHRPGAHPSVYRLLPAPLRQRPVRGSALSGVQAVGRLDQDTTGLLLFSDDGRFIHHMTAPRRHVPKVYAVTVDKDVPAAAVCALCDGVRLADSPQPVRAQACCVVAPRLLHLTLTEGKFHQVKRMVAAVGLQVVALHRFQIGSLVLPEDLPPGGWRWLDPNTLGAGYTAPT